MQDLIPTGASDIPEDPPVKISKQELLPRKFASALFAVGSNEQQVYALIATEKQNRSQLKKKNRSYGGTANDRIRSIFPWQEQLVMLNLQKSKKTKHYS